MGTHNIDMPKREKLTGLIVQGIKKTGQNLASVAAKFN